MWIMNILVKALWSGMVFRVEWMNKFHVQIFCRCKGIALVSKFELVAAFFLLVIFNVYHEIQSGVYRGNDDHFTVLDIQ